MYVGGVAEDVIVNVENIMGGSSGDRLVGDAAANLIRGLGGNDAIYGGAGKDVLYGDSGDDLLDGGDHYDVLIGGPGADTLTGGGGYDSFRFTVLTDSLPTAMDRITDLLPVESIDLAMIDADVTKAGDQAFRLVKAFTGTAGEMTFTFDASGTTVLADVNGDGVADFGVQVLGVSVTNTDNWLL